MKTFNEVLANSGTAVSTEVYDSYLKKLPLDSNKRLRDEGQSIFEFISKSNEATHDSAEATHDSAEATHDSAVGESIQKTIMELTGIGNCAE